ncbi:MAG: DNA mismatch repair protein MutT [Acidobacteria bacterium]|nr:MAG: DNA mismatch repair protein MutT [Acidobacteriota bacterium]
MERRPLRPSVLARIGGRERPPLHWFFVIKFLERCRTMKSIFEGKNILVLERDDWEFVERKKGKEAVAVIAETEDGELILTEQFRRPVNARVIDFPAGLVEDDGPEATAKKELEEETGYTCDSVELLAKGPTSPGITSEIVSIYRAHGVRRVGDGGGVDSEQITVHRVPLQEVHAWLEKQNALIDLKVGIYFGCGDR